MSKGSPVADELSHPSPGGIMKYPIPSAIGQTDRQNLHLVSLCMRQPGRSYIVGL